MVLIISIIIVPVVALILGLSVTIIQYLLADYGICSIAINDKYTLAAEGGRNLLLTLADQNIFIPSACGAKGTCGFCKIKVLNGGGPVLPTELPYLTTHEIKDKLRLACQIKVKGDLKLYIFDDLLEAKEFTTEITAIDTISHDTKIINLTLTNPDTIHFKAGQYIQINIPETDEFRAYSIASIPFQTHGIELLVRLVPGGLCSTYIHEELKIGDFITITGPYGKFYLKEDYTKDIVCIAGGCGAAPIKSIITHVIPNLPSARKLMYFFGARDIADLYYHNEWIELARQHSNFTYFPSLSAPTKNQPWYGETGFIHLIIDKYLSSDPNRHVYICGPEPMIQAVILVLNSKNVSNDNIFYDKM